MISALLVLGCSSSNDGGGDPDGSIRGDGGAADALPGGGDAGFAPTIVVPPTTIAGDGFVGSYSAIAVGDDGVVHIGYYDGTNGALRYATDSSGSWVTEPVDAGDDRVGEYVSIGLDDDGNVHLAYFDRSNDDPKYATNASGAWVVEAIETAGSTGEHTSIDLDAAGAAHVSYYDSGNDQLRYATNASGAWVASAVDESTRVGEYTSLALDADGAVHISYHDADNDYLKYASNTSGDWVLADIDNRLLAGKFTSLAIADDGAIRVGYLQRSFVYVTNPLRTIERYEADGPAMGDGVALGLDAQGHVHIAYHDLNNVSLRYATNLPSALESDYASFAIDENGAVGKYASLTMGPDGTVHISYFDVGNQDLKYVQLRP